MPDFEKSFSDFLDSKEYDKSEEALFSMLRIAYKAGWLAAGGELPNLHDCNADNNGSEE